MKKNNDYKKSQQDGRSFEDLIVEFVFREPFYCHISRQIKKIETEHIKTAGVTVTNGKFEMYYNENFFKSLYATEVYEIVKHEIMHIIFGHCTTRRLTEDKNMHCIANIAMDLAINSLLDDRYLPDFVYMPGKKMQELKTEEKLFLTKEEIKAIEEFSALIESFPKEESAEWYWNELTKHNCTQIMSQLKNEGSKKFKNGKCEGGLTREEVIDKIFGEMDNHDDFGKELSPEEKEVMKEKVREMIEKAVDACEKSGSWGSVSSSMQKRLKKLASKQVNWKQVLRNFVGMAKSVHKTSTMKRVNRRYPYIHPGQKRRRTARIAIAIDQSGSVMDKEIELFFAELNSLSQYIDFEVIPFDSHVHEDKIFRWRKGQKLEANRVACGGTDFNVPTQYVNERTEIYDAMIIFTDGECSKPISCKKKRMYLIPPERKLAFDTDELVLQMTKFAS